MGDAQFWKQLIQLAERLVTDPQTGKKWQADVALLAQLSRGLDIPTEIIRRCVLQLCVASTIR